MKIFRKIILISICIGVSTNLFARDINLDEIYIKSTSRYLQKLILEKLDTYQKINAVFVDRDVIFASWLSGDEVLYIKENPSLNQNIIYIHKLNKRISYELNRVHGVITVARLSHNGRYLILKRLMQKGRKTLYGEMVILNIKTTKMTKMKMPYFFLDFSIPFEGNSIIFERKNRIVELSLDTRITSELIKRSLYSDIVMQTNPSIAFPSPDRKNILVINGSGGNYRSKVIHDRGSFKIDGISSSSEIYWIDNNRIAFRKGSVGNFSVVLYNTRNKNITTLLKKTYNSNLNFCLHPMTLSFLKEQIIMLYDIYQKKIFTTGIEGEDVSLSPIGSSFTSLFLKKLFIVNIDTLKKSKIELRRSWRSILLNYKNLNKRKKDFNNVYTKQYINRKINVYNRLIYH